MADKYDRHSELVNSMSRQAGVDLGRRVVEGTLIPSDLNDAVVTCGRCENVAECESFLAAGAGDAAGVPDYCLNRPMFSVL